MRRLPRSRHRAANIEWSRLQAAKRTERGVTLAFVGSFLCGLAAIIKGVGFYQMSRALLQANFQGDPTEQATMEMLSLVTLSLRSAGEMLGVGNLVLVVGGAFVTYALQVGEFRGRWFFWTILIFSLFFVWQPFVGIFCGVLWLCLLVSKRSEFFAKQAILISA